MKRRLFLILCLLAAFAGTSVAVFGDEPKRAEPKDWKLADLRLRDPFIFPDETSKTYYLVTSREWYDKDGVQGVSVFASKDLETWRGPIPVFDIPKDFWAAAGIWAPELHKYKDKYYLFLTFYDDPENKKAHSDWPDSKKRASQVIVGDSPLGPFKPFKNGPHTPEGMFSLDATLWVEDGVPYMVFCHEWVQVSPGTINVAKLKDDLSALDGSDTVLFKANEAPWGKANRVTDGPFLYRTKTGKLLMLWSSFSKGYCVGIAESESGKVTGPWIQQDKLLFQHDGGHAMIFKRFDGQLTLVLHQPNGGREEHARLFDLEDTGDTVKITKPWVAASEIASKPEGALATKPVYRDPVFDGPTDPVLCWNKQEKKWFMFYTSRRANMPGLEGASWVHGTKIGVAESSDGVNWKYRGTADIDYGKSDYTFWAPEIVEHDGKYHMYLTVVPGIFKDWNASRDIVHLTSDDLLKWKYESTLKLSADRVIDACVLRLSDGTWRMWYNNERDRKSIYYADSPDLYHWTDGGKAVGDQSGEGPKTFHWQGKQWLITDVWRGLAVYSSDDGLKWNRQPGANLLQTWGVGKDDQDIGRHCDVVVSGDRAFLYYFTHPGIRTDEKENFAEKRRSSIQVVELKYADGKITCDRDRETFVKLIPPTEKKP